jgi:adenylyltransferase/sulfurtransferase
VWDPATIDLPDLNRQMLYTQYDVGKWKALQAARQVESINPDVRVQPVTESLTAARFSAHHDRAEDESFVLFDCLDTMVSRAELAKIAARQPAPIFHGGVERWYGQVATLLPDGSGYQGLFGAGWSDQDAPTKPIMPFVVTTIASTMVAEFTHWLESPDVTPLSSRVAYFDGKRMEWRMIDSSGRQ